MGVWHPILSATVEVGAVLTSVAGVDPVFMTTAQKAEALRELAGLEARLVELRLRVLATAGDVVEATAARDAGTWLALETRGRIEDARADHALAIALERRYPTLAVALGAGDANLAQAQVIARALDRLPTDTRPRS